MSCRIKNRSDDSCTKLIGFAKPNGLNASRLIREPAESNVGCMRILGGKNAYMRMQTMWAGILRIRVTPEIVQTCTEIVRKMHLIEICTERMNFVQEFGYARIALRPAHVQSLSD